MAFREGDTVHVFSDKYDTLNSIKAGDRKRHGIVTDSPEIVVHSANQILPRDTYTRAFLANPKNRDNLNNFIFSEWEKTIPQKTGGSQILVLAGGFCDHERAVALTKIVLKNLHNCIKIMKKQIQYYYCTSKILFFVMGQGWNYLVI